MENISISLSETDDVITLIENILYDVISKVEGNITENSIVNNPFLDISGSLKHKLDDESKVFNIGLHSMNANKRSRKCKHKVKMPNKKSKQIKSQSTHILEESYEEQEIALLKLTDEFNPFYSRRKITDILEKHIPSADFSGTTQPEMIKIIIPNLGNKFMDHQAYWFIGYNTKTFFDWQIWFKKLEQQLPKKAKKSTQVGKENIILGLSNILIDKMQDIFEFNQKIRWAFKKLCRLWLLKKCKKRQIGSDRDMITLEPIKPEEIIKLYCISTRSLYTFSGNTVLKTLKSSLETQIGGIPYCGRPKNPFTNIIFTYAQLIRLYSRILRWCSKKSRPLPPIIAIYRETNFNIFKLMKLQNNYLQYKATNTLIHDDDVHNVFFLENLALMLDAYMLSLLDYDDELLSIARFKIWARFEPNNHLIKLWKQLTADYWFYEQTTILIRDRWRSDNDIIYDVSILVEASKKTLENIYKEYSLRPFRG